MLPGDFNGGRLRVDSDLGEEVYAGEAEMSMNRAADGTDFKGKSGPEFELVLEMVRMLEPLSAADQLRVLKTLLTWLRLEVASTDDSHPDSATEILNRKSADKSDRTVERKYRDDYPFSGRPETSAKEFLLEKQPKTDVERLACLAYYLTHFRKQPYFKTDDLSRLNIEAAQRSLSNASFTAKNAWRDGFFVAAPKKGWRQLSALGEQYVQALPDQDVARGLRKRMLKRSGSSSRSKQKGGAVASETIE